MTPGSLYLSAMGVKPNQLISLLMLVFCVLFLSACSTSGSLGGSALQIDGMRIENQTNMHISAVRLLVPATGGFVSCGNIAQHSMCSTTFPETTYTGNPIEITWSQGDQIYSTGRFTLTLPADLKKNIPAMVQVVIAAPGSAGALLIQREDATGER